MDSELAWKKAEKVPKVTEASWSGGGWECTLNMFAQGAQL